MRPVKTVVQLDKELKNKCISRRSSRRQETQDVSYIVACDWFVWCHRLEESVHGFHQLRLVMRDTSFDMQSVQGHAELFSQAPESW